MRTLTGFLLASVLCASASGQDLRVELESVRNPGEADALLRPRTVRVRVPEAGEAPAAVLYGKGDLNTNAPWQVLHALPDPTVAREVGTPAFTNGVDTFFYRVETLGSAEVRHPFPGFHPSLITDVSWGVDEGQPLSTDRLRLVLGNAEAWAATNNTVAVTNLGAAAGIGPAWTPFHFWPNVLNLTEIYFEDTNLYHGVVNALLALDPQGAARAAALEADVAAGERVYLLRDFVHEVTLGPQVFHEVQFAAAVNLEARTVDEWQVHHFHGKGLGPLHDPRLETLRAAFAVAGGPLGEVTDLCLRGNQRRGKFQAVNVDRLRPAPPGDYWIDRMDQACSGSSFTNPPPWDIYMVIPTNAPPPGAPPPPGGRGGGNGAAPPPPPPPDPPAQPPVQPWGHKDKHDPQPEGEPGQGVAGAPPAPPEPCPSLAAILARLAAERDAKNAEKEDFNADMETLRSGLFEWVRGLTFRNPCLQALYDQFAAQVAALDAQIAALNQQLAANAAAFKAARDGLSPAVRVLISKDTIWANCKLVSGPWLDVPPTNCVILIPGIPSVTEIVVVPEDEVRKFHIAITMGLVKGLSWDAAVDAAVANAFNPFYKGEALMESAWRQHADCLRKLVEVQMAGFLRRAFPSWTEEQIREGVKTAFDCDRDFTLAQRAELEAYQQAITGIQQADIPLIAQVDGLTARINELNRQFRAQAEEQCIRAARMRVLILMHRVALLEAFAAEMTGPPGTEVDPNASDLAAFCAALRELIADLPLHQNCPALLAFLNRYLVNCP